MKKEYVSPLFEEVVLMTEDVLTASASDNMKPDDGSFGENTGDAEGSF